jgi:Recombination endonuclease VII
MPHKDPVKRKAYWDAYRKTERCKERRRRWNEKLKAWRRSEEGRDVYYDLNLRALYGIGIAEYKALYAAQGGRCAICDAHQSELTYRLGVDHDHATGAVRGLLCVPCNQGIGHLKDSVELLRKALAYLSRPLIAPSQAPVTEPKRSGWLYTAAYRANVTGEEVAPKVQPDGLRFTPDEVRTIRMSQERGAVLAKRYGVSQQLICGIRKRRRYRDIPD